MASVAGSPVSFVGTTVAAMPGVLGAAPLMGPDDFGRSGRGSLRLSLWEGGRPLEASWRKSRPTMAIAVASAMSNASEITIAKSDTERLHRSLDYWPTRWIVYESDMKPHLIAASTLIDPGNKARHTRLARGVRSREEKLEDLRRVSGEDRAFRGSRRGRP
jgi:hypothetical protein